MASPSGTATMIVIGGVTAIRSAPVNDGIMTANEIAGL